MNCGSAPCLPLRRKESKRCHCWGGRLPPWLEDVAIPATYLLRAKFILLIATMSGSMHVAWRFCIENVFTACTRGSQHAVLALIQSCCLPYSSGIPLWPHITATTGSLPFGTSGSGWPESSAQMCPRSRRSAVANGSTGNDFS